VAHDPYRSRNLNKIGTPHESNGSLAGAAAPAWYTANEWDKPGSPLTPGAAIAFEVAFDAALEGLDTEGESDLVKALPARFAGRYDDNFFERFAPVLRRVYGSAIANPNQLVCTCTADEIALEVLVQLAKAWAAAALEMAAEVPGAFPLASPEDQASLSDFHSQVVADSDVLFLWNWQDDGIEDDEERMAIMGIGNALKFENWFAPFEER
jgi:hypothetical protein